MNDRDNKIRFVLTHNRRLRPPAEQTRFSRTLLEQQPVGRMLEQQRSVRVLEREQAGVGLEEQRTRFEQEVSAPVLEEQQTPISHTYLPFGFEVADLIRP